MNLNHRQLQYAIELSKTRSFSQASEILNISQPALSKQILALEQEIDVKLFDRTTVPLTLTPAGEYFIRQSQTLLYQEDQMLRSLEQFKSGEKGRVSIGVSPFRNLSFMPQILKKFKEKYPGIRIDLHETTSDQLRRDATDGKYDFAIVNLPVDESALTVTLLKPERLVVAIPNAMLPQLTEPIDPEVKEMDFSCCRDLPFIVVAQSQEMRRYFDTLCAECDMSPEITVEVSGGVTTAWSMACAGIGATLLPMQLLDGTKSNKDVSFFYLKNSAIRRQPAIVTRRGQYIAPHTQYLMELLCSSHTAL